MNRRKHKDGYGMTKQSDSIKNFDQQSQSIEKKVCSTISNNQFDDVSQSDITQDLMILIGQAIEIWAERHNMQNLPKDILFQQALASMNGIYNALKNDRYS